MTDGRAQLARRLRSLRTHHWPSRKITQVALAKALGVSPALISGWESESSKEVPPVRRLDAYATFFASERSVEKHPFRLLAISDLTEEEQAQRDDLFAELVELRDPTTNVEPSDVGSPFEGTLWHFPQGEDITIVCSELPKRRRVQALYTDPAMPDYVELYKFADLDALLERHGHIRAVNPRSQLVVRRLRSRRRGSAHSVHSCVERRVWGPQGRRRPLLSLDESVEQGADPHHLQRYVPTRDAGHGEGAH